MIPTSRQKMEADQTTPAQSAWVNTQTESTEGLERVTTPAPVITSPTARPKDPKKVAAGRAGVAARRARQESLLAELRAAKAAIAPAATPVADETVTQSVKQQEQPVTSVKQQPMPAPADPVKADWTPWILVGAGLAVLCVWRSPQTVSGARQQKQLHPEAAPSASSGPVNLPQHPEVLSI